MEIYDFSIFSPININEAQAWEHISCISPLLLKYPFIEGLEVFPPIFCYYT